MNQPVEEQTIQQLATKFCNEFEPRAAELRSLEQQVDFMHEEYKESRDAVAVLGAQLDTGVDKGSDLVRDLLNDVVDGFGDCAFLGINGVYKAFRFRGDSHERALANTEESLRRICQTNLAKRWPDGEIHRSDDGREKILKPEGWTPPSFTDLLESPTPASAASTEAAAA